MSFITDFDQIASCDTVTGMAYSDWEPTLNDSSSTSPNYIENSACMFWPLSKGVTDGYGSFQAGSESMSGKILVGFIMQTLADIGNIPVTELQLRFSSAAALATNYAAWNVLAQIVSPFNAPVSGLVPIICHEDNTVETGGTPNYSSIGYVGYLGTTGNDNDGKQGWFDHFFVISYVGEESADYATTPDAFFDQLAAEAYDSDGSGGNTVPDQDDRPLGIFTKDGDSYTSNVSIQIGSGSGDTAISVNETGKTIKWNNVHADHNIGYVFKDPATGDCDVEMTDITNIWAIKQGTSAEIFTDASNAVDWKWDGCSFTRGGKITLPPDSANRYFRNGKFTDCGTGTASNGEFIDSILNTCGAMVISGDADFRGSQLLTPGVAADTSGLVWNGNYDPDGNLDGMAFTKGTNAHHAIEFGTGSPLTMTLRNITVSGFNASDSQNDSVIHVKRTSGTVTINLVGCTGTFSYKSAGATVVVASSVTLTINVQDEAKAAIQNAQTSIHLLDSPYTELMNEDSTALGVATEAYSGSTPVDIVWKVRKSDTLDDPRYSAQSGTGTITSSGFSLTVTLKENPLLN